MAQNMLRALGLMSGTSLDGIDAAIIETDGLQIEKFGPAKTWPYPAGLRQRLRDILGGQNRDLIPQIEYDLTLAHAKLVEELLQQNQLKNSDIDVIGFHGHTILHRPQVRHTWQIGDGALLAKLLNIPVVGDFRSADVHVGGQGAPLVPVFHRALAMALPRPVALLNIGGVANVTWIGEDESLLAFDTGPGNALIDDWALLYTGKPIDIGGKLAHFGQVDERVLTQFSNHPYFSQKPPKSLDRDDFRHFSHGLVQGLSPADGAATLTRFTARAVALAAQYFPAPVYQWLVCGGGRLNPILMRDLRMELQTPLEAVEMVGWDGDAFEAQAFAYLAVRSLKGYFLTYPNTTSCPEPMRGGTLYTP